MIGGQGGGQQGWSPLCPPLPSLSGSTLPQPSSRHFRSNPTLPSPTSLQVRLHSPPSPPTASVCPPPRHFGFNPAPPPPITLGLTPFPPSSPLLRSNPAPPLPTPITSLPAASGPALLPLLPPAALGSPGPCLPVSPLPSIHACPLPATPCRPFWWASRPGGRGHCHRDPLLHPQARRWENKGFHVPCHQTSLSAAQTWAHTAQTAQPIPAHPLSSTCKVSQVLQTHRQTD